MRELFVHLERCLGCLSCQMACAVAHSSGKNLYSAISEAPKPKYRLHVVQNEDQKFPMTCRHCEPSPCVDACIAGALSRDDRNAVLRQEDRCTGCWTCIMVCPYGVVTRMEERKTAVKCDLCPDLEEPACVNACPTKAIVFVEADDMSKEVRTTAAGVVTSALKPDSP